MAETVQQYVKRIGSYIEGKDPVKVQKSTPARLAAIIRPLKGQHLKHRPAPGKWSIAEVLAHMADAEVAVSWRLRMILSSNGTPIQAFDQDKWAATFQYAKRNPKESLETFRVLRENNLAMLKSVSRSLWNNYGMHQERGKETVKLLVQRMGGHDLNHLKQIEEMAKAARRKRG
jgi:hypothetical protein